MYDSLFINCSGSNLYVCLGALQRLSKEINTVKIWNITGNASLIFFFKVIGLTYKQTFDKLKKFHLVNSMTNGNSLFPEDQEEKKQFIYDFLEDNLERSSLFHKDVTLGEIENLTGLKGAFIVWSRSDKKIVNLFQSSYKLIDCVMATLTNIGIYDTYHCHSKVYSSLENIDCMPISRAMCNDINNLLYILSISTYDKKYSYKLNLGPMKEVEDELLIQKGEYNKYRIENSSSILNKDNTFKIYSFFSRGDTKEEEKISLYSLGTNQATGFIDKEETYPIFENYIKTIYEQT